MPTRLLCSLLLLVATLAPARAEPARWLLPASETGFVSAGGGLRVVPQGPFLEAAAKKGQVGAARATVLPSVQAAVAYRIDRRWSVNVDFGWSRDAYGFQNGTTLELRTIAASLGGARAFDLGLGWIEPYLGGGAGSFLTFATKRQADGKQIPGEASASGLYAALGVRAALSERYGLVVENRYSFAFVPLDTLGIASVGGNTLNVLFYGVWRG